MRLTRHPDGRLLGAITYAQRSVLLDLEKSEPAEAVSLFHFIAFGAAPKQPAWLFHPWGPHLEGVTILTYRDIISPNVELMRYLSALERERNASYERIPGRVRRHDRA